MIKMIQTNIYIYRERDEIEPDEIKQTRNPNHTREGK